MTHTGLCSTNRSSTLKAILAIQNLLGIHPKQELDGKIAKLQKQKKIDYTFTGLAVPAVLNRQKSLPLHHG
jgi:hypothetical protein